MEAAEQLGLPVMVKPSDEGSSIGMTKVERPEQMRAAWELASGFNCDVLAEEWVAGPEYTAAVLHDRVLPLDPHPDRQHLLRLPGQVLQRRHPLPLSVRPAAGA